MIDLSVVASARIVSIDGAGLGCFCRKGRLPVQGDAARAIVLG
jgi:hypothetical protein